MFMRYFYLFSLFLFFPSTVHATVFKVGPTRSIVKPCDVLKASPTLAPGDIIEIDGADAEGKQIEYIDDFCDWRVPNLTFRGVGAKRPHIRRQSANLPDGQGIWRPSFAPGTKSTYTFENLEMSGARSGTNSQPIWPAYTSLVIRSCYFHNNDNGLLMFNEIIPSNQRIYDVLIEKSEFANNGVGGGQTHNVYIGAIRSLTFRYNYSHDSNGGQLLKSRAGVNYVLYNRFVDNINGISNYESDFSNGGRVYYIGNIVYQAQGNSNSNSHILVFRTEGTGASPTRSYENIFQELYVTNNTFVNGRSDGAFIRYFGTPTALVIKNNIFAGPGTILYDQSSPQPNPKDNVYSSTIAGAGFVDGTSQNYYLTAKSPAIDAGGHAVGSAFGQSLSPDQQYLHLATSQPRPVNEAARDAGAYEYGTKGALGIFPPKISGSSSTSAITLQWSPAYSEEAAISTYQLYKNGALLTKVAALSYTDTTTKPGVANNYYLIAESATAKSSAPSNTVSLASVRPCTGSLGTETGWCQITNTKMTDVCLPNLRCPYMLADRGGATYDTTRDRLVLWGGSLEHQGNEIYALNAKTLTMTRVNNSDTNLGGSEATPNGRPNRRRTFNNLAYIPDVDKMLVFGGAGGFGHSRETWLWAPSTDTWTLTRAGGTIPTSSWGAAVYNPKDGKVYYVDTTCVRRYNLADNTWEVPAPCQITSGYHYSAVIDPVTQRLYIIGGGDYWYYDISSDSAFKRTEIPATGCREEVKRAAYPGLAYDPKEKQIVIWTGKETVYTLDSTGTTCTAKPYLGGPTPPYGHEVLSRWQYSPAAGGFFVVTEAGKDAFFLRLSPASTTTPPTTEVSLPAPPSSLSVQ